MNKLLDSLRKTTLQERQLINISWLGFLIYTLSYTLVTTTLANYIVCQILQIIGLMLFLPSFFSIIKFRFENRYLQLVFFLYLIWIAVIVVRGFHFNFEEIQFFLFNAWFGGILYLTPLFLLMPLKLVYLKKVFHVLIILAFFFVIYDIVFIRHIMSSQEDNFLSQEMYEYFARTLAIPCFFLLMVYSYQSGKKKFFLIFIFLLTVFFALVRARRGLLFMCGLTAVLSYLLFLSKSRNKFFFVFLTIICGGILFIFGLEFFASHKLGIFSHIADRGLEDTRSTVEICFYQDLSLKDWIIGKGMMGEYFCPGIDSNDVTGYRGTIETDYLQIILKGGVISLSLFLLITIPAIFKGFFYSNNLLSKAAGMWILLILLNMYPANLDTFTMQYILLWISVGICYSKAFRKIPDHLLMDYFKDDEMLTEISEDFQN
jgi:hypothetical protein